MLLGKPTEVLPNVYQVPLLGTSALLLNEDSLSVIDGGWRGNGSWILKQVRRLGRSPQEVEYIIPTHGHPDHIGGIPYLRQHSSGRVAAHESEPLAAPAQAGPGRRQRSGSFSGPLLGPLNPRPFPVDIPLEDGSRLDLLGGMQVIHSPGHTPGSICLHFPHQGLLMVGDALQCRRGRPALPSRWFSADLRQAGESIRRLAQLDFEVLCFSHFPPIRKGASRMLRQLAHSLD